MLNKRKLKPLYNILVMYKKTGEGKKPLIKDYDEI